VSVAVVCYVPSCASAEQRKAVMDAIATECDSTFQHHHPDSEEEGAAPEPPQLVEMDSEEDHSQTRPARAEAATLAPSDDDEEEEEEAPPSSDDDDEARPLNVLRLKRKILKEKANVQTEERNIAVRKSNISLWEDQLKEHFDAVDRRKRAREEEVKGTECESLVDRDGCVVDTTQEQRKVVAAYIKDLGEYADVDATLTEHFTSAKRQQRTFKHERGAQMLRGEGYGLGVSRFQTAQVRHDYMGHCDERKVAVVLEAKDECSYFNVGVAQMQLKRAEVSLQAFPDHTKFYHAAYATAPPCNDINEHNRLGHTVYSPDMTVEAKRRFFAPLKEALEGERV
jgi:hypothetical protein